MIYVAAGNTAGNSSRSGIQTAVRRLAGELGNHHAERARVVFWNWKAGCLHHLPPQLSLGLAAERIRSSPSLSLRQKLSAVPGWWPGRETHRIPLHRHPAHAANIRGAWLLLPELLYRDGRLERFIAYARRHGLRIAAILYDTIPVDHPELCRPGHAELHRAYLRGLSAVDLVLPISESSALAWHEQMKREKLVSPKVRVVPLATEIARMPRVVTAPVPGTGAVRALCVSTIEPRKNHRTLLAAVEQIAEAGAGLPFELDLAGSADPSAPELEALVVAAAERYSGQVRWHRRVDSHSLRRLYSQCDFTVYPSIVEGFGLPVVESLWLARPCVCANFGVMAENARAGGCLTVDVRDPNALAGAMRQLATDLPLRQRLALEAVQRPLKSWREYADDIVSALDET
jgi:glycosyltransferase involved in cell wall biosynthesis